MLLANLKDRKFGKLIVIERDTAVSNTKPCWICLCDCGIIKTILASSLVRGLTKSCGCKRRARMHKLAKGNTFSQLPKSESGFRAILRYYKGNAKRKNIEFALSAEQFKSLITQNCYYCGIAPINASSKNHTEWSRFYYNGLDRIDCTKGYVLDNVLPCCKRDNYIKNVFFTVDETKVMVDALEDYRRTKQGDK